MEKTNLPDLIYKGIPIVTDVEPPEKMFSLNSQVYGDGGFSDLRYKGLSTLVEKSSSAGILYFQHIYHTTYDPKGPKRHMCLQHGYWCWKNAYENPKDVIHYIRARLHLL